MGEDLQVGSFVGMMVLGRVTYPRQFSIVLRYLALPATMLETSSPTVTVYILPNLHFASTSA